MAKKILKIVGIVLAVLLAAFAGLVCWLTVTEYKPDAVEDVEIWNQDAQAAPLAPGDSLTILSQNTGYAGLGKDADFFMDGGKKVNPTTEQEDRNREGLVRQLAEQDADIYFLQEVDTDSSRSGGIDQSLRYYDVLGASYRSAHALNYSCSFVPYPLPPIGKVHSGVQTLSRFGVEKAERIALPCPFSWPVSTANLKRCLLVSYVPLENSDKQLVLVNLHLEAYDDGEGKAAQTEMLLDVLTSEYEKGNYVIAGGDFNKDLLGNSDEIFGVSGPDYTWAQPIPPELVPEGLSIVSPFDGENPVPSCRNADRPYGSDSYVVTVDGFIVSANVSVERAGVYDTGFRWSDHNPVYMDFVLR